MSTSSVIGSMQSALNCAGKCDCCEKLQQQINAINARLSAIKPVNESALKNSIKASLQPDITIAVAGGIAVITNRYGPQITDAVLGSKNAQNAVKQLEPKITDAVLGGQAGRQARARVESLDQYVNTVSRTATSASTEAATASRAALNTSLEVSGLRNFADGIGKQVNAFGRTLTAVEKAVGDATVAAAKAVGISSEALAATGRLAGRILEIFQVIGTIFTIIEQLQTLVILG
ncbi:MAG: hypothetical protein RMY64_35670, partial [Nostoc sp. DedQUE08]|uniref:hypothetical protein n=1 Tax=Nostoc sp. DedQUE08 TaxID=3075393 RepID=UPI002AD2AD7F